jgi:dienelactone hydrolase
MKTIIASDIYGRTPALMALAGELDRQAVVLSPWDGEGCPFATEQEAHRAFVAGEGVAGYAARVTAAAGDGPAFLVGLSAGATAVWLHTAGAGCHPDSRAVLFYGSRIRNHLALRPRCRVQAIFAEIEAAFDPKTIIAQIVSENVTVHIEPRAAHGFMNPLSPGYGEDFARKYGEMVRQQHIGWMRRQVGG